MQWFSQAPSNIALIKYMGKKDEAKNIPINPSLSYTLNNLITSVTLQQTAGSKDFWEPLEIPGAMPFAITPQAKERFLNHLTLLKEHFNYDGAFIVRSSNNFPTACGLASSASSFAALTKCANLALSELTTKTPLSTEELANLSRIGSGSSCRSFFAPWALWDEEQVQSIDLPYQNLLHQVIVISNAEKKISSREAHKRINSSILYSKRPERARKNLEELLIALKNENWSTCYEICWREFQDLHQLFETCSEAFSYMTPQTKTALNTLSDWWHREGDGPIVTMDAGPNIHLLYRADQDYMAQKFKNDYLLGNYDVLF